MNRIFNTVIVLNLLLPATSIAGGNGSSGSVVRSYSGGNTIRPSTRPSSISYRPSETKTYTKPTSGSYGFAGSFSIVKPTVVTIYKQSKV